MKECKFCGSTLPNYAHFCARCGHVVNEPFQGPTAISSPPALGMPTLKVNTPPLMSQPWHPSTFNTPMGQSELDATTMFGWSGEVNIADDQHFHERDTDENEAILPGMMLLAAQMAEGPAPAGNVPLVQGTPQVSNVPLVQGTPRVSGVPAVQGTPAMPAHPAGVQALYHNAPASAPAAPAVPSWVPHTPPAAHLQYRPGRKHVPRPHGLAQHLLVAAVAVVVIATSAVTGALAIFRPDLSLSVNGGISPGGTLQLHGQNFTPGSSVTLTLDQGVPLSAMSHGDGGVASYGTGFANVLQMFGAQEHAQQAAAQSTSIPVSIQGTFDVTIHVGQHWSPGVHTIHATDRLLGRSADLQFMIPPSQAKLVVTPSSVLDFGTMNPGTTKRLQETVSNSGGQPLNWNVNTGGANWLAVDSGNGTVQSGSQQTIKVTADTTNLSPGPYSATLNFTSNGGNTSVQVSLVVNTPIQPAQITVNPNPLDFGKMDPGATKTLQVTVGNSGGQPLTWHVDTGGTNWLSVDKGSDTVQAHSSQTINVKVTTRNLSAGPYSATLNFTSNGGNASVSVTLTVNASSPPPAQIAVSPNPLDFGKMDPGTTQTLQVTVKDAGGQLLNWHVDTGGANRLSVDKSSDTVQPGSSETINVTVDTSSLSPGSYSATLNFTSNGGNAQVQVSLVVNTPVPTVLANGTWQGQGTFNDGRSPFDMTLTICACGNSFSGTLTENAYNTTVNITGTINGDTITFTDTSYVSGDQIQLNCTYTATVTNGQMSGVWYYPGHSSPDGTIMLNQTA